MREILVMFCTVLICFSARSQAVKVLFVGNSLTVSNDLPSLVEREAKSRGVKIKSTVLAYPNYALVDHWNDGDMQKHIINDQYHFVIVQQGPSSQNEGMKMLLEEGARLKKLCAKHDTKLAYLMVWPSRMYFNTFKKVIENHEYAARVNKVLVCPVGKVWKAYFDETGDFSYYSQDGFHPSLRGSQIAAEVVVNTILANQ